MFHPWSRGLFVSTAIAALLSPASAMTNEMLLKERLISPTVYELLKSRGATTSEQRYQVIRQACAARQLAPIDCEQLIKRRSP